MKRKKPELTLKKLEDDFFARADAGDYDLNYCIPINVGIISQDFQSGLHTENEITYAVEQFGEELQRLFGRFASRKGKNTKCNDSRVQLTVFTDAGDTGMITRLAAEELVKDYHATVRTVNSVDEMREKCWLVLALWDGITSGEIYDKVKRVLSSKPEYADGEYRMIFPKNRPVFQIILPVDRQYITDLKAEKKIENYSIRDIYPRVLEKPGDGSAWYGRYHYDSAKGNRIRRKRFMKCAKKIRKFNAAIIRFATKGKTHSENVYDLLPDYRKKHTLSLATETAVLRQICYDVISMKAQEDHKSDLIAVLGFAGLGLIFFSMYSDYTTFKPFIFIFLALFSLAYIFRVFGAKLQGHQNYYLEFRALAESMRVQCYWYAAGIDESVGGCYRVKFNKDMTWANYALDRWYESDTSQNRIDFKTKDDAGICREWLVNQYGFFNRRIGQFEQKTERLQMISGVTKFLWVIVAVSLAVILIMYDPGESILESVFILAIGLMNVVTLATSYINEKLAYRELVAKYTYCKILAEKAVDDFNSKAADPKEIFKKYGEEALEENAEWLMIENDRETDVPNG